MMKEEEKHEISIMDPTGDTKVIWDPENEDEVEYARETFDKFVNEKGFAAFNVGRRGKKDE